MTLSLSKYTLARCGALALASLSTVSLCAEDIPDEVLEFDRPEAWAMKYVSMVALMQADGAPRDLKPGKFALGFELSNIPYLSLEKRTVGFNGTKEENMNKSPVLARPLLHYAVTERLSVTGAYVPPIEVFDRLRTHLVGLSVGYEVISGEKWGLDLRATSQWTEAKGDFTGAEEIAGNPDRTVNPLGVLEPSNDTFTSWTSTAEVELSRTLSFGRDTRWFLSGAVTYADLDFEIDALLDGNFRDNRHQVTDGWMWSLATGVEGSLSDKLSLRGGLFYAPLTVRRPPEYTVTNDAVLNFRITLNYKL